MFFNMSLQVRLAGEAFLNPLEITSKCLHSIVTYLMKAELAASNVPATIKLAWRELDLSSLEGIQNRFKIVSGIIKDLLTSFNSKGGRLSWRNPPWPSLYQI